MTVKSEVEAHKPHCQFSGESCSTDSPHYRKVISHIFGRNKRCTIGVPDFVWIYYCRKHYQRARYRTGEWPFRQCDLAIDTIKNMRAWGGVEDFNLQLRRRETTHRASLPEDQVADDESVMLSPKHEPRSSVDASVPSNSPEDSSYSAPTTPEPKKRAPKILARPVPEWLYHRIGNHKSFGQVLSILRELRQHLQELADANQEAHFPDIEILPNLRQQSSTGTPAGKHSRVSSHGSVEKISKK